MFDVRTLALLSCELPLNFEASMRPLSDSMNGQNTAVWRWRRAAPYGAVIWRSHAINT
jgi:hypothetical protein